MFCFQFISSFVSLVPIVDCSGASEHWKDLTEVGNQQRLFKFAIFCPNRCIGWKSPLFISYVFLFWIEYFKYKRWLNTIAFVFVWWREILTDLNWHLPVTTSCLFHLKFKVLALSKTVSPLLNQWAQPALSCYLKMANNMFRCEWVTVWCYRNIEKTLGSI